ncbi:hypothetical protein N825_36075 [Skermanella stibiiresistens SB22]|uniref:Uncharacterized protein n=1 Tax=Skermanella stibiiresistens SB22 TaxID=1385369 RepID=W9GSQ9_9PROT|nr:hypothetical protein N825_36075 [Skermanella stibiiresistens SB22]
MSQTPTFTAPAQPEVVPGQFIVKFRDQAALSRARSALAQSDFQVVGTLDLINAQVISIDPGADIGALGSGLSLLPPYEFIEPVYRYHVQVEPGDTDYAQQWAWPKIAAPAGWDIQKESPDVVVAVIDTGVDYRHADLSGNIWRNPGETPGNNNDDDGNGIVDDVHGANFVPATPTGDPMDDNRHGTHVSGTIGAMTDNALGVSGAAWKVQIMGVKFLDANGSGTTVGAIDAIQYAVEKGAHIMNNSWGGGGFSRALQDAIAEAEKAGILFTAAAGNNNQDNDVTPFYPANYDVPNVLSVMATTETDGKAAFSHRGATTVDVGAPGVNIRSTTPGNKYDNFNGTSMATPHVSGLAALIKGQNPDMKSAEIKRLILQTADPVPALTGLSVTGGRINMEKALAANGCAAEPAREAYQEFFWPERRTFNTNSNVVSVPFNLPHPMYVDVTVNGSARRTAGSGTTTFRTGVYTGAEPNVMWTGSYRTNSFTANGESTHLSSEYSLRLPAGQYTIYWKLWPSGATMEFDSGTITVRAFPCSAGGKLAEMVMAAASSVEVASAEPNGLITSVSSAGQAERFGNLTVRIDEKTGESVTVLENSISGSR